MIPYFSHDIFTRESLQIKKLMKKMGLQGYGIFWVIVEFLHRYENKLDIDSIELIADDIGVEKEKIESVIYDFKLFTIKKNVISSKRVAQNLKLQKEKSKKAQMAAFSRWRAKEQDANALQSDCETNAINKKNKKKENNKTKEIENSNEKFFGVMKNVFLSSSNFKILSELCEDNELFQTIIDELSENIALKKESPYDFQNPDFHFIRLQKYLKQKLLLKKKAMKTHVVSVQKTNEYLNQIRQEQGVPPPKEFFESKENLMKKIKEQKNDA